MNDVRPHDLQFLPKVIFPASHSISEHNRSIEITKIREAEIYWKYYKYENSSPRESNLDFVSLAHHWLLISTVCSTLRFRKL